MSFDSLVQSFHAWDDLHFYGLIKDLDPKFCKSGVVSLEVAEDEKKRSPTSLVKAKTRAGLKVDPGLFAEFVQLIKLALIVREEQRRKEGKDGKVVFDPSQRFGGQDIEDLKDELEILAEFPEEKEELKEQYSKLIQRLSESYLEQQTLQDSLQLKNLEHENQLVEVKDDAEKRMQDQMRSIDERYKSELEEKEAAYQKMVDKYTKMKMKYKKTKKKNKFLHSNTELGFFKGGKPEDGKNGENWKAKAMQQLSEREEEILELQNKIFELKSQNKANGKDGKGRRDSLLVPRRDSTGVQNVEDLADDDIGQLIRSMDGNTDIVEAKEAMMDLVRVRNELNESLTKSRQKVSDLEDKVRDLDQAKRKKERQLLRDNATMMRQVMKLRTALQGADIAIPVTARSARNQNIQDALKVSKTVTRNMSMARAALDDQDDDPETSALKEEIKRRRRQVDWLARRICRWRSEAFGCVHWARFVCKAKKTGRRPATSRRSGRGIQSVQANMERLFAQQKAEIQMLLTAAGGGPAPHASHSGEGMDGEERKTLLARISELEKANASARKLSIDDERKQSAQLSQKDKEIHALESRVKELEGMLKAKSGNDEISNQLQEKVSEMIEEQKEASKRESGLKAEKEQLEAEARELKDQLAGAEAKLKSAQGDMETKAKGYMEQMEEAKRGLEEMSHQLEEREAKMEVQLEMERKKLARAENEHKKEMREFAITKTKEIQAEMAKQMKVIEKKMLQAQEAYKEERILRIKYHNMIEDMKGKIRVYCRIRPMSKTEKKRGDELSAKADDKYTIAVSRSQRGKEARKEFSFDEVFGPTSQQDYVYENTANLIQSAYDGYNVCIFAYGQTGTGKTFTMYGEPGKEGIAPRAIETLYECVKNGSHTFESKVTCYMVELYKSALQDLLDKKGRTGKKLRITKNSQGTVEVQGAIIREAKDAKTLLKILDEGNRKRVTSSTNMNAGSSRSHLILSILIQNTNKRTGVSTTGKLSLVDLAGCERASKTGANAQQLKEAQSINQSLSALGNVIAALSTGSKHVPYRSHVLTNLMSDSLGGNAKTLMFVNVSPSGYNTDETINALNYATRVKLVKNAASKTIETKAMREQAATIAKLKAQLEGKEA